MNPISTPSTELYQFSKEKSGPLIYGFDKIKGLRKYEKDHGLSV